MNMQWHHMIPKELGGSDDESNYVLLTTADHAAAHMDLFRRYGNPNDLIEYRALSAQAKAEAEAAPPSATLPIPDEQDGVSHGQKYPRYGKGIPKRPEHKAKIAATMRGQYVTDEHRAKIAESMKGNSNSKNHSTPEYKEKHSKAMKEAWVRRRERMEAAWDAMEEESSRLQKDDK